MRVQIAAHFRELKKTSWLFGLLLFSSFVLGMVGRFDPSPWPEAITSAVDAVVVLGFVVHSRAEVLPLLAVPRLQRRAWLQLAGASLAFITTLWAYFALLERAGVPTLGYVDSYQKAGWPVWSMFVLISVTPAVFEELAFRGVIQSSLERVFDGREAWLIQGALFSVLHLSPLVFPSHFVMGLCFGWMRLRSKSIYPGMALHATWNALVLSQELYGVGG